MLISAPTGTAAENAELLVRHRNTLIERVLIDPG